MAKKANSPWGTVYKEGLPSTAVNDQVFIDKTVSGTITTGVIDSATGQWKGITVSDDAFTLDAVHEAVPNGATVTSPQGEGYAIDMTGYSDLQIAIKGSEAGNHALVAVMSGDVYYSNLSPLDGGSELFGALRQDAGDTTTLTKLFNDTAQSLTADVWNIFYISTLRNQKSINFKITNNTGSEEATLQFAYLRVV